MKLRLFLKKGKKKDPRCTTHDECRAALVHDRLHDVCARVLIFLPSPQVRNAAPWSRPPCKLGRVYYLAGRAFWDMHARELQLAARCSKHRGSCIPVPEKTKWRFVSRALALSVAKPSFSAPPVSFCLTHGSARCPSRRHESPSTVAAAPLLLGSSPSPGPSPASQRSSPTLPSPHSSL